MISFKCEDAGSDCPFKTEAKTEKELMNKIYEHYEEVHGVHDLKKNRNVDLMRKIKKAIKKN